MHEEHTHDHEHEHTHVHTHTHTHADGSTHEHAHEHTHTHPHAHEEGHTHEHSHEHTHGEAHTHDHEHGHSHAHPHDVSPKAELAALLRYMVDHNAAHAQELVKLADRAAETGAGEARDVIVDAVATFTEANEKLARALKLL